MTSDDDDASCIKIIKKLEHVTTSRLKNIIIKN